MTQKEAFVIGAGLAGCEAAWQMAKRGIKVTLYEMKPHHKSPAHKSNDFCELVCSNSLRGAALTTGPGLLKEELRRCGSIVIECADKWSVPAGGALAVERNGFSAAVTEALRNEPNITVIEKRVESIPEGPGIIATGPLTDGVLAEAIQELVGGDALHFFDAAAPIVYGESIDMTSAFYASRYQKGGNDYINCPLNKEEYIAFRDALATAEEAEVHGFEDKKVFEGCMPVEVMARRGPDTLRYGPMKPVGIVHPETGERYYAVLQLRKEDNEGLLFNLVGCQTHLRFPEQKRVFSMIPALKNAEFMRYGVMHRNSYISSPGRLDRYYRLISRPELMFAGQITGVEGYVESCASGLAAGINMARSLLGMDPVDFPAETAIGALAGHVSMSASADFQPMNINFGLLPALPQRIRGKRERYQVLADRALAVLDSIMDRIEEGKD